MAKENEKECCPRFDPGKWDGKVLEWKDKRFVKDKVRTVLYVPMNMDAVMRRLDENVRKAGSSMQDGLVLYDHTSKWNMDVLMAVDKEVQDLENTTISGKFLFKVYEGDFKETGKWCEDYKGYVRGRGMRTEKMYMWYTTCPDCAKKYGKNYVAIVGRIGQ